MVVRIIHHSRQPFDGTGCSEIVCSQKGASETPSYWTAVCDAIGVLAWRGIWSADNPVESLNVHLSLLVECFVPTKVIRVRNNWINLG